VLENKGVGLDDLGLFNGNENQCRGHGNVCQRDGLHTISCQVHNIFSFFMQEVSLFWVCLVLHAIKFFVESIECLYSFFFEFREESDGDVYFVLKFYVSKFLVQFFMYEMHSLIIHAKRGL